MDKKISNEVYFLDGCVIEHDFIYVACNLEEVDPEEYAHTRMSVYDAQSTKEWKWFYHDLNCNVVSVCVKKATPAEGRKLCSLSKEGEVEVFYAKDGTSVLEKIPDAGARLGTGGYVTQIREIGSSLYVCGQHGQVYKRTEKGWTHQDSGLFRVPVGFDPDVLMFNSIDGSSENDIYVAGDDGKICHYDGKTWRIIATGISEHLNWIRVCSPKEVWACGYNGALLKGNAQAGFKDMSGIDDNLTFQSLVKFQEEIYLSTLNDGVFKFDGKKIKPVDSGLTPPLQTYRLDAVDQALWSFGIKDIAFFNGAKWERINHPDNPPIR